MSSISPKHNIIMHSQQNAAADLITPPSLFSKCKKNLNMLFSFFSYMAIGLFSNHLIKKKKKIVDSCYLVHVYSIAPRATYKGSQCSSAEHLRNLRYRDYSQKTWRKIMQNTLIAKAYSCIGQCRIWSHPLFIIIAVNLSRCTVLQQYWIYNIRTHFCHPYLATGPWKMKCH